MSNRNRKLYIALGIAALILTAFFGWSLHSIREYQKEHAQKREYVSAYQAETAEQYPEVCFNEGTSVASLFKCLIKTVDANRNSQRSQYDLQAQQEMAEWAYALLLLTAAGFFASVIGLVALFYSLGLNRRALLIAVRGNRNTVRAINQEQKNAQRELRAYVGVKRAKLRQLEVGQKTTFDWERHNFGQTPAYNFEIWTDIKIVAEESEIESVPPNYSSSDGRPINPGDHTPGYVTSDLVITQDQMDRINNSSLRLYFFGAIKYIDVFDAEWHTAFRLYINVSDRNRLLVSPKGNGAT